MFAKRLSLGLPLCLAALSLHAGPREEAIVALMRLSERPNYTWASSVHDDARLYEIDGRTSPAGYSIVKMPLINSLRRRLGRELNDNRVELIFRGNARCVLQTKDGWFAPHEVPEFVPEPEADAREPISSANIYMRNGVVLNRLPTPKAKKPVGEPRGYSNLQLAISHPHEDLAVILSSHADLQVEGDSVSGTLTDRGAQLLLVRDGQKQITPLRAAGTFKVWFRERLPVKYQLRLDGVLLVETSTSRRQVAVRQHSDTVIRDVGRTAFFVPDQAIVRLTR